MAGTVTYLVDGSGQTWAIGVNADGSLSTTAVSSGNGGGSGGGSSTTNPLSTITAGDIIDSVIQDAQIGTTNRIAILDYVDRTHKRILRESQWKFLRSQPQRFITEPGVTQYFIASGNTTTPNVSYTSLNLTDVWSIDAHSVFDRTNNCQLNPDSKSVLAGSAFNYPDGNPRYGRPRAYSYDLMNPGVFNLFPAPDNQCTYQPVPLAPSCSYGEDVTEIGEPPLPPNRTYYVYATFVDQEGNESTPSTVPTVIFVPYSSAVTVLSPVPEIASAAQAAYESWNVYIGTATASATKQNSSPIDIGTSFTEPNGGLIVGTAPPTANTLVPLYGYVIEFCYYVLRQSLNSESQILQVPDVYRDVVIAGANYYCDLYLNKNPELNKASLWKGEFLDGLRQIRKDLYINYRNTDFLTPDPQSQMTYTNGITLTGFSEI